MGSYQPAISRIAIIGAGPVGVAFAKYLIAEQAFDKIDIFEQRDRVGGIWNLSAATRSRRIPIPQTDPRYGQGPSHRHRDTSECRVVNGAARAHQQDTSPECSLEFESPLYDYLEANIPKSLMAFSDTPFPATSPLFPSHREVLQYLEEYSLEVRHLIHFSQQVLDVTTSHSPATGDPLWHVTVQNLTTHAISTLPYDAVVVANGHYTVPSVPPIPGISRWSAAYPGAVIHSKAYRTPEQYTSKKVLVMGNSASGLDIAFQIGQHCHTPILLSSRSVSAFGTMPAAPWRKDIGEVVEFLPPSNQYPRAVRLQNGDVESNIDAVVFATGYFYSYPFLRDFKPDIVTDGLRTRDVYRHLFHIEHPSLVFPVINTKVVPFPLAENQAAVVTRVWSGRLGLPSNDKMLAWEEETIREKGDGKYFHLKKFPEDAAQINELYAWAKTAARVEGLENGGQGKLGTGWDERMVWVRSRFPEIKARYAARREGRWKVRTVEELGFDFEGWRRNQAREEKEMVVKARCELARG